MKISRRTLIGGTVLATGVVAVGGYRLLTPWVDSEGAIAAYIAAHVPQVSATDPVVVAFAADAVVELRNLNRFEEHLVLLSNPTLAHLLNERQTRNLRRLEQILISRFMRSTDTLLPRAPGTPVSYLAYADPYTAGCSNPIASLA